MLDLGASITGEANPLDLVRSSGFKRSVAAERSNLWGNGRERDDRDIVDCRRGVWPGPLGLEASPFSSANGVSSDSAGDRSGELGGAGAGAGGGIDMVAVFAVAATAAASASATLILSCSLSKSRLRAPMAWLCL